MVLGTEGHRFKSCLSEGKRNGVWPKGMAAVFGTVKYGFESYDSKRKKRKKK